VNAAHEDPDGSRLLFQHAAREEEFAGYAAALFSEAARIAKAHVPEKVPRTARRQWLTELMPKITIEVTLSWLDAGRPVEVAELSQTIRAVLSALG
jgi:hypothetical protein